MECAWQAQRDTALPMRGPFNRDIHSHSHATCQSRVAGQALLAAVQNAKRRSAPKRRCARQARTLLGALVIYRRRAVPGGIEFGGENAQCHKEFTHGAPGIGSLRCDDSSVFSGRTSELANLLVRFHGSVAPLDAALLVAARQVPPTTRRYLSQRDKFHQQRVGDERAIVCCRQSQLRRCPLCPSPL